MSPKNLQLFNFVDCQLYDLLIFEPYLFSIEDAEELKITSF